MSNYEEMSPGEVVGAAIDYLNNDLDRAGYDIHYPNHAVAALQNVMAQADDIASGDHLAGFGFASATLLAIGSGLRTTWPKGLEDRLRGRIAGR